MSIETLRADLKANLESLKTMALPTADALKSHLVNNLWPFIDAVVDEVDEIDESVEDMVAGTEVIHTATGEIFTGLIVSGEVLVTELVQRAGNDQRILALVREWRELAKQGKDILEEIVIPDPDPEPDDEDADDKDDDHE